MSTQPSATATHDQDAHASEDHHPHVLPLSVYFGTGAALFALTALTVLTSGAAHLIDLGSFNIVLAFSIATLKACIVAAVFMHLYFDNKFHTIIFASSVLFLFIFIAFTMFDTSNRGQTDLIEGQRAADVRAPFAGTQRDLETKTKFETPAKAPQAEHAAEHH